MLKYKKAQISDTMTWIVATIVIIVSLSFFVFLANLLAQGGAIKDIVDTAFSAEFDLDKGIKTKTDLGLKINPLNEEKINNWIAQNEE